jgi:hypothetical protein
MANQSSPAYQDLLENLGLHPTEVLQKLQQDPLNISFRIVCAIHFNHNGYEDSSLFAVCITHEQDTTLSEMGLLAKGVESRFGKYNATSVVINVDGYRQLLIEQAVKCKIRHRSMLSGTNDVPDRDMAQPEQTMCNKIDLTHHNFVTLNASEATKEQIKDYFPNLFPKIAEKQASSSSCTLM